MRVWLRGEFDLMHGGGEPHEDVCSRVEEQDREIKMASFCPDLCPGASSGASDFSQQLCASRLRIIRVDKGIWGWGGRYFKSPDGCFHAAASRPPCFFVLLKCWTLG